MSANWLLSLDPGIRHLGLAVWHDDQLFYAQDVHASESWRGPAACRAGAKAVKRAVLASFKPVEIDEVVFESVEVYKHQTGKQSSLFETYGLVCAMAMLDMMPSRPDAYTEYKPKTWTSGRPKEANHERIRRRLDEDDLIHVRDRSEHVWDAIGVGLYHLTLL